MTEYQQYINLIKKIINLYFQHQIESEEVVYLIENIFHDINQNTNITIPLNFEIAYDELDIPFFSLDVNGLDSHTNLYGVDELNKKLKIFIKNI
jgi:hypothetical protein